MIKIDHKTIHLSNFMRKKTESRSTSSLMEFTVVVMIIMLLNAFALTDYKNYIYKALKAEIYAQFSTVKNSMVVDYSLSGKWPDITYIPENSYYSEQSKQKIVSSEGSFELSYQLQGENEIYTESVRLVNYDVLQPTLYWVCGYSQARKDEIVATVNSTNAPVRLLTKTCRHSRN